MGFPLSFGRVLDARSSPPPVTSGASFPHTPIPCIPRAGLREKLSVPPPTPSSHDAATADGRVAVGFPTGTAVAGIEQRRRVGETQS